MGRGHTKLWVPGSQQDTDSKPRPVRASRPPTPNKGGEFQNDPRSIARRENCLMLALEEEGVVFVRGLTTAWWQPEEWRAMREAPSYRVAEIHGQQTVVFPFVQ